MKANIWKWKKYLDGNILDGNIWKENLEGNIWMITFERKHWDGNIWKKYLDGNILDGNIWKENLEGNIWMITFERKHWKGNIWKKTFGWKHLRWKHLKGTTKVSICRKTLKEGHTCFRLLSCWLQLNHFYIFTFCVLLYITVMELSLKSTKQKPKPRLSMSLVTCPIIQISITQIYLALPNRKILFFTHPLAAFLDKHFLLCWMDVLCGWHFW